MDAKQRRKQRRVHDAYELARRAMLLTTQLDETNELLEREREYVERQGRYLNYVRCARHRLRGLNRSLRNRLRRAMAYAAELETSLAEVVEQRNRVEIEFRDLQERAKKWAALERENASLRQRLDRRERYEADAPAHREALGPMFARQG